MRSFDAVKSSPAELTTDEDQGDQQSYAEWPLSYLSRENRAGNCARNPADRELRKEVAVVIADSQLKRTADQ